MSFKHTYILNYILSTYTSVPLYVSVCEFGHSGFPFYSIKRLWLFLSAEATRVLAPSLVILRLDYCNSLQAVFPPSAIHVLHLIQKLNLPKFPSLLSSSTGSCNCLHQVINIDPCLKSPKWAPHHPEGIYQSPFCTSLPSACSTA